MRQFQRSFVAVLSVSMILAGCQCRPDGAVALSGEVRWEWEVGGTIESDSAGRVDFPATSMGGQREQTLWVRNVGRAPLTMSEFALLAGSPVTLNDVVAPNQVFEVRWQDELVLAPTERTEVTIRFTPPRTDGTSLDYESSLQLRPVDANASPLTLTGRAIAGQCELPETIDFGSVPLMSSLSQTISVRNDGVAAVVVTAGGVTGAPVGLFEVKGVTDGQLLVEPGTAPALTVTFTAQTPGDFTGTVVIRRSEACPSRTVTLKGRGVSSCLTWEAAPAGDSMGREVQFGAVAPGATKAGTVTWKNECSVSAELTDTATSEAVFALTSTPTFVVPAATRDASGAWQSGSAVSGVEFRPTLLGNKLGQLRTTTSFASQAALSVVLKGFGGGPRIQVTPSPIFAVGRIGFTPGAMPGTSVQRALRITNVGNRPVPADVSANLHLGVDGQGPTYFEVRAINGRDTEICVGDFDTTTGTCSNTLSSSTYDAVNGIEAVVGAMLNLPVRITPETAGLKEWEITIYSNDVANPEVRVRVTAEALEAPPCNYTVTPTTLSYGVLNFPQTKDLSFTLTNLGTAPSEVCYFNGIGLTPTSNAAYSVVSNPIDVTLPAGQSIAVTVRAQPTAAASATTQLTGAVEFNVSSPVMPQNTVRLEGSLAPSCLTITPSPVTFADTELECGSPERAVTVTNSCSMSVNINSATVTNADLAPQGTLGCATAGGCPQFALSAALPPGTLLPGASRSLLVRFRPFTTGSHTGELSVSVRQGMTDIVYPVPLVGLGKARTSATCGVTVSCPAPMTVSANSTVTLAPNIMAPGAVSCAWSVQSRPTTSNGTFSRPTNCVSTTYFADVVGTHLVNFNVSDGAGGMAQCTTPITVTANGDLWIELTWNKPNDMDLHLLHPNAGSPTNANSWFNTTWDCNFVTDTPSWSATAANNPSLDRDDIAGQGPENIRINTPVQNINYAVGVHMYSYVAASPVTSTVKVYCGGQLITTQTRTMSIVENMWVVGRINFGAATPCQFTALGSEINVPSP